MILLVSWILFWSSLGIYMGLVEMTGVLKRIATSLEKMEPKGHPMVQL